MQADPLTTLTPKERRAADPGRTMAFTDGVFAIIITLLVLDLRIPDVDEQPLWDALPEIWSSLTSFVVSFLLVGMYWDWHRSVFAQVRYLDLNAVWLNLLFLLPTSMLPFAAATLGDYGDDATALYLYGTVLIAATSTRVVLDVYLRHHPGLLWAPPSRGGRWLGSLTAAAPIAVYVVAMLVAGPLPKLALSLYFAVPALYLVLVAILKTDPRTRVAAEEVS